MDGTSIVGGPPGQGCSGDRGRSVASAGGGAVWCERGERDPLAAARRSARDAKATAAGRRSAFGQDRGACRAAPGCLRCDARHHPCRVAGAAGRSRHPGGGRHDVAVLPPSRDHAQKKTAHATEQDRPDIVRREDWFEGQLDLDPDRLVFIDETWASTNMARRYGRAPRGERLRAGVPHGHWKTTTFVAGLRRTGMVAPWVLDGPMNGDAFTTYVTRVLVPELAPGDVVIMDNLSSHKAPAVRAAIEAAGAELMFLPPYSPDFNPIEMAFSKLKPTSEKPPSAPSTASGTPSAASSTSTHHRSAPTTSPQPGTMQRDEKPL